MEISTIQKRYKSYDFASKVDLTAYSANNKFTIPKDGILHVYINYEASQYAFANAYDSNGHVLGISVANPAINVASGNQAAMPVFTGMTAYGGLSNSSKAESIFIPYK